MITRLLRLDLAAIHSRDPASREHQPVVILICDRESADQHVRSRDPELAVVELHGAILLVVPDLTGQLGEEHA